MARLPRPGPRWQLARLRTLRRHPQVDTWSDTQWCDASLSPGPGLPATTRDIAIQCLDQEAEPACDFTEEEITIARRPGEKLGFGLRFEGGGRASECVRRLYIQVTRDNI